MIDPNCPECHGTGEYRGSLSEFPEPCSLCSRLIPISEPEVTIQFENPPVGITYNDPKLLRLAWEHAWKDVVDEVVLIEKGTTDIVVPEGYRARSKQIGINLNQFKRYPDSLIDIVWSAVHAVYYSAVWRVHALKLETRRGYLDWPRHQMIEKAYICPDVDIKNNYAYFTYFADWRRQ